MQLLISLYAPSAFRPKFAKPFTSFLNKSAYGGWSKRQSVAQSVGLNCHSWKALTQQCPNLTNLEQRVANANKY
eukprot:78947-Amphidinium_carterae.1